MNSPFFTGQFALEMTLILALFVLPLKKRNRPWLRFACGFALAFAYGTFVPIFTYKVVTELAFLAAAVWFTCDISWQDALYCTVCAYAAQHIASGLNILIYPHVQGFFLQEVVFRRYSLNLFSVVLYVLIYFLFGKKVPEGGQYQVSTAYALIATGMVLAVSLFLNIRVLDEVQISGFSGMYRYCTMYDILCCVFILLIQVAEKQKQQAQRDRNIQKQLYEKQKEQYQLSDQYRELINRRYHDMKYRLAALRQETGSLRRSELIDRMEEEISVYEMLYNTGNPALDTILTEKSLTCKMKDIPFTCMADGEKTRFIDPVDLYILCGNALDNAMEESQKIEDPDKRMVSVRIGTQAGCLQLAFVNACQNEVVMKNGLPVTTKEDAYLHGFGVGNIRDAAAQYGGQISIDAGDGLFSLCVTIPLPEAS